MNYIKNKSSYVVVFLGFFSVIFFALSLFFSTLQRMSSKGEILFEAASIEVNTNIQEDLIADATLGLSKDLVIYQVKENDSTWKIAEEFLGDGYRYIEVEVANGLVHNQELEVGQMLYISQSDSVSFASLQLPDDPNLESKLYVGYYTVEMGDSLWSIAYMQYGDSYMWKKLYMDNYALIGSNPGAIQPGMKLML